MSDKKFSMDDYIDVAERITELRDKHPEARLRPLNPERPYYVETIGDSSYIVYAAACYLTPDDPNPGVGVAWEPVPGLTPYTRNSELQNAETSAWGRAIVAALVADTKRGVASANEVRNRQGEPDRPPETHRSSRSVSDAEGRKATDKQKGMIRAKVAEWREDNGRKGDSSCIPEGWAEEGLAKPQKDWMWADVDKAVRILGTSPAPADTAPLPEPSPSPNERAAAQVEAGNCPACAKPLADGPVSEKHPEYHATCEPF